MKSLVSQALYSQTTNMDGGLRRARLYVTTRLTEMRNDDTKKYSIGKWTTPGNYDSVEEYIEACKALFPKERNPDILFLKTSNFPDGLIYEGRLSKAFYKVHRDLLEEELEDYLVWEEWANRDCKGKPGQPYDWPMYVCEPALFRMQMVGRGYPSLNAFIHANKQWMDHRFPQFQLLSSEEMAEEEVVKATYEYYKGHIFLKQFEVPIDIK